MAVDCETAPPIDRSWAPDAPTPRRAVCRRRPRGLRRLALAALLPVCLLVLLTAPASAHSELEPATAAPGSVVELHLSVENERSDAGTVRVQLQFPHGAPLPLVAVADTPGWTATAVGGSVGGTATGIDWSRPSGSPDEDPVLAFTVGPLPAQPGRLQFKVVQTYTSGEVDRWIEDWPAGAAEPEMPGPVLDLQAGAPGSVPPATTAASPTTASSTSDAATVTTPGTATATTTTTGPATPASGQAAADDGGGSNAWPIVIGIVVAVVVLAAIGGVVASRRRAG